MGFTRHWSKPNGISSPAWEAIVKDTKKLLATVRTPLTGDDSDGDPREITSTRVPPQCTKELIMFNGIGDDACEPFVLTPEPIAGESEDESCKTDGMDYDTVVAAVLMIAKEHAPSEISVSCDEPIWEAWMPGYKLCCKAGVEISKSTLEEEDFYLDTADAMDFT